MKKLPAKIICIYNHPSVLTENSFFSCLACFRYHLIKWDIVSYTRCLYRQMFYINTSNILLKSLFGLLISFPWQQNLVISRVRGCLHRGHVFILLCKTKLTLLDLNHLFDYKETYNFTKVLDSSQMTCLSFSSVFKFEIFKPSTLSDSYFDEIFFNTIVLIDA